MSERRWLRLSTRDDRRPSLVDADAPTGLSAGGQGLEVAARVTGPSGTVPLSVSVRAALPDEAGVITLLVVAAGEVDLDTAPLLRAALVDAVDRRSTVCCDLTDVTFLSAAGVAALVAAHNRASTAGSQLVVRGARGTTRRVLQITGLEGLLGGQ
jgi:anti-anti-sigma factor